MIDGATNIGVREAIQMFLLDVRQAFVSPASNPMLAALSIVIILILVAIVVVLGISIYLWITRRQRDIPWVRVKTTRRELRINRGLLLFFVVSIVVPLTYYSQHETNCLNCHSSGLEKKALDESAHSALTCVDCHKKPGVSGYFQHQVDFFRKVTVYLATNEPPQSELLHGNIVDGACLKCHRAILRETTASYNIRVNHDTIRDGSSRCIDCHNQVAHPGVSTPVRTPSMPTCLLCHDGVQVASECSTCHIKDIGDGARTAERRIPQSRSISLVWNWCYDCHDERRECLPCHGITMPHPPDWDQPVSPSHARPAAFTSKTVCWRCHYSERGPFTQGTEFCETCHPIQAHGRDADVYLSHRQFEAAQCVGTCHAARVCTENCHTQREARPEMSKYPFYTPDIFDPEFWLRR